MLTEKCATMGFHLLPLVERPTLGLVVADRHWYKRDEPEEPMPLVRRASR